MTSHTKSKTRHTHNRTPTRHDVQKTYRKLHSTKKARGAESVARAVAISKRIPAKHKRQKPKIVRTAHAQKNVRLGGVQRAYAMPAPLLLTKTGIKSQTSVVTSNIMPGFGPLSKYRGGNRKAEANVIFATPGDIVTKNTFATIRHVPAGSSVMGNIGDARKTHKADNKRTRKATGRNLISGAGAPVAGGLTFAGVFGG